MKETVLNCCKYALFAAAAIPFLVIAYVMFPVLTWSWRIGAFLPFVVLLLWGALHLLKTLLARLKAQPRSAPQAGSGAEVAESRGEVQAKNGGEMQAGGRDEMQRLEETSWLQELQDCWQTGIDTLLGSHLKQEGDPLYVLPWFLVTGESGSGKSAALTSARLRSPFAGSDGARGGTGSCDWRFYDQGVLIDTAGRYAVASESTSDHEEWLRLLWLLRKYRRKDPVNGLILTLPADKLLQEDRLELEEYGRQLRLRMDEMTRLLGISFPVYLLITKCDLIGGMTRFCARLPEQGTDQPMGLVNQEMSQDVTAFLERFWAGLDNAMRSLRLILLHRPDSAPAGADFLLFPDRLRALKPALHGFMLTAFGENHYQETPLLRGIYLCSAGREGASDPGAAKAGDDGDPGAHPAHRKGLFLHEFFEKVLPGDRGLWAPTPRAADWQRKAGNVAVAAAMFFGISLCALLTCSFVKNLAVIREAAALMGKAGESTGEAAPTLAALEAMRGRIVVLEQKNREWWVPRFGLNRSREVEEALKARYCRDYRDRFLLFFDRELTEAARGFSGSTPDPIFGSFVVHLSRRCNLVKARLGGAQIAELAGRPLPDTPPLPPGGVDRPASFAKTYLDYLVWSSGEKELSAELQLLQSLLRQSLALKGSDLLWLLGFVNWQHSDAAISLQQFWRGSRPLPTEPSIDAVFTRKGRESLGVLFDDVSSASPEWGALAKNKESFQALYRKTSFDAWRQFAWQLPAGEERLQGSREWRAAAETMSGEQGPYFAFIRRVLDEFGPSAGNADLPLWIMQLHRFQVLKASGGEAGVASSVDNGRRMIAERLAGGGGNKGGVAEGSAANVSREYLNALGQIAPVAKSRDLAYRMALQAFNGAGDVSKSPIFQAVDAAQRLNAVLQQGQSDATFSRLVSGPITFYGTFIRMETACALQAQWEEKVLKEVQGASDPQTLQYLLGKDGPVWKYLGDFADPFIGWSPARGYYAKSALGGAIPFRPEFYSFLAKGARAKVAAAAMPKASYQVTITGLPTDANGEARIKPQGTRLELNCATGPQVMANMNYPVSKPFVWSPESCGDVILQIEVGDTVLTRRYAGARGFPAFLRDFPGGRQTFYSGQFPQQKEALERMGVRFIRVNYRIFGAGEVPSSQGDPLPGRVPAKIAECWD